MKEPLLDAGVETDAPLRLQTRIVGEGQLEAARRADARAEAAVQPRGAKLGPRTRLVRKIGDRNPRVHLDDGACGEQRPGSEAIRRQLLRANVVHAHPGRQEPSTAGAPAVFRKIRQAGARQQERRAARIGDKRILDLLAVVLESAHQKIFARYGDFAAGVQGRAQVVGE